MPYVMTHDNRYATTTRTGEGTAVAATIANIIWYAFAIAEAFLLFRIVLQFIGASVANGLVDFIYRLSSTLIAPFSGILGSVSVGQGVLNLDALIAMLVYYLIAKVLTSLIQPRYSVTSDSTVVDTDPVIVDRRRRNDYRVVG